MYQRQMPLALKIDRVWAEMMVAYKTVIAPGEHYITSGVAVVSKLHRSQLQFKAELPLLTAGAPCLSLSVPPRYKKSIGFQIAEEFARLILNGHSSPTALSALVRCDEGNIRGLWALTLNSDTGLQWIFSWVLWHWLFIRFALMSCLCEKRCLNVTLHIEFMYSNFRFFICN